MDGDNSQNLCVIRIQFYDRTKYVKFDKNDVGNWEYFVRTALIAFDIDPESKGNVFLWDGNETEISQDVFRLTVLQYLHCNNFSIKMCLKSDPNEPLLVHELKYYMLQNGCRGVFLEMKCDENGNVAALSDESVNFIVNKLMAFIDAKYSMYKWDDIQQICKAAVAIFPSIELERLIDMQKKSGHIFHRVQYLKYKKPARQGKKTKSRQPENNDGDGTQTDTQSDDAIDELAFLLFFKTCIVERDVDELKKRLELSIDMREKLINKKDTEFHKLFPFYFIDPLLINFDFAIRNTAIDPDVLSKKWPAMKVDVLSNVKAKDRDDLLKYFNEDIGFYLCLLKLLVPANASLPSVISKLIIFSDKINDDPNISMDKTNDHPYILAMGEKKTQIQCFYIVFEKKPILMPIGSTFDSVFDTFFKLFYVFDLEYNSAVKNFLVFVEHYIYDIDVSPVNAATSKIAKKIIKS